MINCGNNQVHLDKKSYDGHTTVIVNQDENQNFLENIKLPTRLDYPTDLEKTYELPTLDLYETSFFELHFDHKRSLVSVFKIILLIIITLAFAFLVYKLSFCVKTKIGCFKTACNCLKSKKDSVYKIREQSVLSRSRPGSFEEVIYDSVSL